jgi:hypothetical protein
MPSNPPDVRAGLPSASGFERVANCPGSHQAVEGLPSESSKEAQEGTEVAEALAGGYEPDDKELAEIAKRLTALTSEARSQWYDSSGLVGSVHESRERRFWIHDSKTGKAIGSAQCDVVFQSDNKGLVVDHKTGFLAVTKAEYNWQLKVQAVAVAEEFNLSHIRVAVAHHRLTSKLDVADFDADALSKARWEIEYAVERSQDPEAPRFAGKWCRYCPAKSYCREAMAWAIVDVADIAVEEAVIMADVVSVEALRRVYEKHQVAEKVFEAVKKRLLALSDDTLLSVGMKRGKGSTLRNIKNNPAAIRLAVEAFGDPVVDASCKLMLGELEAALAEAGGHTEHEAKVMVNTALADVIEFKEGAPKLVVLPS